MHILAVETATQACSAALLINDTIIAECKIAPREHSKLILPMIDALLVKAALQLTDLDCIAFGAGPGSFIGVRIATSLAQGLAYGATIPVVAVSSLQALAQNIFVKYNINKVVAAIDARMQQIYHGLFELDQNNIMQLVGKEAVTDPIIAKKQYSDDLAYYIAENELFPTASSVATIAAVKLRLGQTLTAAQLMPSYIRNNVVRK